MCSFLYVIEVIRDPFPKVCTVSKHLEAYIYTCDKVYDISRFTCNLIYLSLYFFDKQFNDYPQVTYNKGPGAKLDEIL